MVGLVGDVTGQNSWAAHLRRSAKRIASVKKSLISRGLAKKAEVESARLTAAEYGRPGAGAAAQTRNKYKGSGGIGRKTGKKLSSLVAAEQSGYGYFARPYEEYQPPARQEMGYSPPAAVYPTQEAYSPPAYQTGSCHGKPPGMIGNPEYNCKIFHVCQVDGRFDKMDCPSTLRFNNYLGVCDWPNKVDEYCNPIYYYSEKPQRESYRQHPAGNDPYMPSAGYEMSYAAAERYSSRAKVDEAPRQESDRSKEKEKEREKEKEYGKDKKDSGYTSEYHRKIKLHV
ncbi:hypothetical protein BV898_04118 [Hypsibius exemplaris]|uniref:Chitin-binding type-2 domain-containing protein n=1 Tax=Hypsibius exemplaris TaxID=2072580 RepID=A0A1W0X335_HYPEX|nr:hypothetical protein BV898_04118 [Hypsibius exemplaris]